MWYPALPNGVAVVKHESPNHGGYRSNLWVRAINWHISDGSLPSTLSWLSNPASEASAHFVIGRDGTPYQLVDTDKASWTAGNVCDPVLSSPIVAQTVERRVNPNLRTLNIECVGYSRFGVNGGLTMPQINTLVELTALLCWEFMLTADKDHILGHYYWDRCTRANCPGFSPWEWLTWRRKVKERVHALRGW